MKAYKAWNSVDCDGGSTVVFAETVLDAKKIAAHSETCEDARWIDIRVRRFKEMDVQYRGRDEINWYDMDDRTALVELGWSCYETSWECDTCPCKEKCDQWEE